MTKVALATRIINQIDISQAEALLAIHTVLNGIVASLQRGQKVEIRGFGSFKIRVRRPRLGRNPKTGECVAVPAKNVVYFKPGKELAKSLN